MVPHLTTGLAGPINELEQRILEAMPAIERWFRLQWMEHQPPFYSSVDVRNAGFKLAPVDTNLFPAGWNNLTEQMLPLAVQAAMASIEKVCPDAGNLLIVPENHTRNLFYLMNVAQLVRIFQMAGLNVHVGSISPEVKDTTVIDLPNGDSLTLEPVISVNGQIGVKGFTPCTVLLNNDLSAGVPGILEESRGQHVQPPLHGGWHTRLKSNHCKAYEDISKQFGKMLGIDPWLINPMYGQCGEVNFAKGEGLDCLQTGVNALLNKIRRKYKEYGIQEQPFVVVKADNGTYGMGIMMVKDAKELEVLNRKTRNKMNKVKDGQVVSNALIQEGVHTYERVNESVAEPVVYMLDRYVVGGFYRVHADRRADENLNAPGAQFVPLAFDDSLNTPEPDAKPGASPSNRFYMYGVIARLSMLAASYELEATDPDPEGEH